jgi:hypothetical protein
MPKREDKTMPDQSTTQADPDDQVGALDLFRLRLAMHWLATEGPTAMTARRCNAPWLPSAGSRRPAGHDRPSSPPP